ncbi:hypothetical protein GCM10010274_60030 [Streptomyces lavendofoliae]|uniref:STAS domain-containing protein n=1 Tax=Streptomyces lavendofoliae TaxID=67314 RepID=A0A918I3E0_9ACTN|nr:hypothetical protein GCM10010274_60030 [Streptomyces lavendofoliae]
MTSPVDGALELRATPTASDTCGQPRPGTWPSTRARPLAEATGVIKRHPHLRHLHLHPGLAELSICDSLGLSALLRIERFTSTGARLHLDNRSPALDRLLALTGTYDHLVRKATDDQSVPDTHVHRRGAGMTRIRHEPARRRGRRTPRWTAYRSAGSVPGPSSASGRR